MFVGVGDRPLQHVLRVDGVVMGAPKASSDASENPAGGCPPCPTWAEQRRAAGSPRGWHAISLPNVTALCAAGLREHAGFAPIPGGSTQSCRYRRGMGAWGPGLYSDDYALDLRATLAAVCRLPIDGPEIVKLLCDLEPASLSPEDEDYATFWLVVADQLHRRGIPSRAEERALAIIDDDSNLKMLEELGMSPADLKKRRRNLGRHREALTTPAPDKQRKTLKNPQALVVEQGQVYTFPVDSRGNCVNPYFTDATRPGFVPKGWGAFLVANTGHALGYLAWYRWSGREASPNASQA